MAFLQKANLVTFAGPMVVPNFSKEISPYTEAIFWKLITSNKKMGRLKFPDSDKLPNINPGNVSGQLVGGNLAVFVSLIGTQFLPNLKDKILLLEDVSEFPYKIDRMMNQLRLNQTFKRIKGIILGRFVDCFEHDPIKKTLTLSEVMEDYLRGIKVPTIYTFPHGHINDFITLPIGINIKLNATKGFVEITESSVR
jgi:muramoyltetrapeptide carboxypeptidase